MPSRKLNVLFVCTGNSARSVMGEAALNAVGALTGKFQGFSAGSHPKGQVHPLTLELLERSGLPTAGLRSKSWDEFAAPGAPPMDFIFTVCDQAAGETCPYWPGQPVTAHWGLPDPAAAQGTLDERRRAFAEAFERMRRRVEQFAQLPFDTLDRDALRERIRQIGTQ
jgi:arsenate reductase (thioredoxin)